MSTEELSAIARQGSGSACRSLFGGFVGWSVGERADGEDSRAFQIADEAHWPELSSLVLIASARRKDVPSTEGMQTSVATSELLAYRAAHIVPRRMEAMAAAIREGRVVGYSLDRNGDSISGPLGSLEEVHFPPGNAWNSDESMDTLREKRHLEQLWASGKPPWKLW